MRKKMNLDNLQEFYQTESIIETGRGFEMLNLKSGLRMILPDRMYFAADGKLIDPTSMLTVPRVYSLDALLGFEFDVTPLELQYLCGKVEVHDEDWYFWPADLKSVPTSSDMQSVLLKAHWDQNQNVDGRDWNEELRKKFHGRVVYVYCDCDEYREKGDWYWVINVGWPPVEPLSGTGMFGALFSRTMRPVLQRAGKAMSEFRKHRREYGEKIKEIAEPVLEQLREHNRDCIMIYGDDESVLLDFNYGPRSKVQPEKCTYRHDSVGLKECEEDFAYFTRYLQTKG